jgi:hypothetical protein
LDFSSRSLEPQSPTQSKGNSLTLVYRPDIERFLAKFVAEMSREEMMCIWGQTIKHWLKTIVTSSVRKEKVDEEIPNG